MLRRVFLALSVGALGLVAISSASAGTPQLSLSESAPSTVLYGTPATVTLSATNPSSGPGTPVYNTSFTDVLPLGVSYVAGSSSLKGVGISTSIGDPIILVNEPSTGQTTLIWSNVGDLQPSSTQALSFQLQAETDAGANLGPNPVLPGSTYSDTSAIYANTNPRYVPQFDPVTGAPISGPSSYTDSDTGGGTTQVVPLKVAISEPSPEGELPRGVHDHQVAYTVTVTNNDVHATTAVSSTVYLPADLEFLGCGAVDNTTDAVGTNPGSTQEYPGAGSLAQGTVAGCPPPSSVTTVLNPTTSGGTTLSGVFTAVTWTLSDLGVSGVDTFHFAAAVPLRDNTMTWSGTAPSPTSLGQTANLDNNTGAETFDTEAVTTIADTSGTFSGALGPGAVNPISAEGTNTAEAVDLAVQKSSSTGTFIGGQVATFSLHYETSEYRYSTGTTLTDHVPSGMCPVGAPPAVYTDSDGSECTSAVGTPSIPYSSVVENSDGSFDVTWDLATLAPNSNLVLSYPVLDRAYYQGPASGGISPTTPTLGGDSLTNTTSISGTVNGTCFDGPPTAPVADPTCSGASHTVIYSGESTPSTATNGSHASQTAPVPTVSKEISLPVTAGGTLNCATATYVNSSYAPIPVYEAGDTICFHMQVNFPVGVSTHDAIVTDFLPPNTTYVPGSLQPGPLNTATLASVTPFATSPMSVEAQLGDPVGTNPGLYVGPGQVFEVTFAMVVNEPPNEGNNYTFIQNLMKLSALNTAGQSVSLRDQVGYNLSQPVVDSLSKAVTTVNGLPPGPTVKAGDQVGYSVTMYNAGLIPTENGVIWDNLPSQITDCATEVTAISDGGTCASPTRIVWNSITVPAGTTTTKGSYTLTYTMTVPSDVGAGELLTNHAGVVSYQAQEPNNSGVLTPSSYYPTNNIDPLAPTPNAPAADQTATVTLASPTYAKTAAPTINGPRSATIGEPILYTLTETIPAGVNLYHATITDPLGTRLTYSTTPHAVSATYQVGAGVPGALPGTFTLVDPTTNSNTVELDFPATFATPLNNPITIVVSFYATVANVGANAAGATLTNTGTFSWQDSSGHSTSVTRSASSSIVEPSLSLAKTDLPHPAAGYGPGDAVNYTVTLQNTGTSAAYDAAVVDSLPIGMGSPTAITDPTNWTHVLSGTGATGNPYVITWTLTQSPAVSVGVGASTPFTYTSTMPSPAVGSASFQNNVSASATSLDTTADPGARTTYSATDSDTVKLGGPTITKTASPTSVTNGVDSTYTVTVTIPAGLQFPSFTVIDTLPSGVTFDAYGSIDPTTFNCVQSGGGACPDVATQAIGSPSGSGVNLGWWIGNLAEDAAIRTITLTYTAYPSKGTPASATPINNAVASYWTASNGTPPATVPSPACTVYCSSTIKAPLTVIAPSLGITKSASTSKPTPGVSFTYTISVKNNGTSTAYPTTVTDPIPATLDPLNTSVTAGSPSQGSASITAGTLTWDFAGTSLAVGATATLSVTTMIGPSAGLTNNQSITNTATVNTYYGVPVATATGDPSRYPSYTGPSASAVVAATFPALSVTKTTPGGTTASVGSPFTWKLAITDTTAALAKNVAITDTLPTYWTYTPGTNTTSIVQADGTVVSGTPADPSVSTTANVETLTWSGAQLAGLSGTGGSTNSIAITYTTTPQTNTARTNTNTAFATGQDNTGASANKTGSYQSLNATATATVPTADLQITKSIASGLIPGSASNSYDLVVKNNGPDPANAPVVNDTAPIGTTFTGASGTGWTCTLGTGGSSIQCTASSALASGATASTIQVAIAIPSSYLIAFPLGSITNTATVSSTTYDPDPSNNSSTVVASAGLGNLRAVADLGIVKSLSGSLTAGAPGTYLLDVNNYGPSDSPGTISVTDSLPVGLTYAGYADPDATGWTCSAAGQAVTCSLASGLTSGQATQIVLNVQVAASLAPGPLSNTAIVSGPLLDPVPGNNTSTKTTTVLGSADLAISKTHANTDTFVPGTNVHYTLQVSNNGPSDAATPIVQDTLPSYLSFVSANGGTGWNCGATGQVVTCTATANLAAFASADPIALVAQISPSYLGGTVTNTATVSSATPDPVSGNNSSTDSSASGTTSADLSIAKSHSGSFTAGTQGIYDISVTNHGPSDAAAPTVVDTLPIGESYVTFAGAAWSCSASGQLVTCNHSSSLAAGATDGTLSLTVLVASDVAPGTLTNTATVSSTTPDPVPGNNTSSDPTSIVTSADLSIVKSHTGTFTPGTDVNYTLQVANAGPSDAAAPSVSDVLPAGESYVGGSETGWSCGAVGQTVTCTMGTSLAAGTTLLPNPAPPITLTVAIDPSVTSATLVNTATVSSTTADPVPGNNSSTDTATVTPSADLSIVKSHSATAFTPGTDAVYTLQVANAGPSDAVSPTVTDVLPAAESSVSATGAGWTCTPTTVAGTTTVTCTLTGSLAAGTALSPNPAPVITLTVLLDPSYTSNTISNTAVVSSTTPDPDPGNNSSTDVADVGPNADLSIVKSHTGNFRPGTNAVYTLQVTNAGPSDANDPVVSDTLPPGETFASADGSPLPSAWTCSVVGQAVTCAMAAPLAAGSTSAPTLAQPILLTVAIGGAAYPTVSNTAVVSSTTPDPDPGNNSSTDVATVVPVDDLSIVKDTTATHVLAGEHLTYSLKVANAGPTPDPGPVTVSDQLPASETFTSATGAGWTCHHVGQAVTCTYPGAMAVHYTGTISLKVLLGAAAAPHVSNTATVAGAGTDPNPANNTSTAVVPVAPGVKLALTKELVSGPLVTHQQATYRIGLTNLGPSVAQAVVIRDDVPTSLTPISASGTDWTCTITGQLVICSYASDLAAGSSTSLDVIATVEATSGTVVNTASVSTSTGLITPEGTIATSSAPVEPPVEQELAFTGANLGLLTGIGVGLVTLGAGFSALVRRRATR